MLSFRRLVTVATAAVMLAAGVGCRRAAPDGSLADRHPGLDPKPAERTLWDGAPLPDPERGTIDLSRPESIGRSFDPSNTGDPTYDAAMRGEAWAQREVGKQYVASPEDTVSVDQGVRLLQQAAEQNDAEALFVLGSLSMSGLGMPQSTQAAFDYCRRAAELNFAEAQYELAAMYALGRGTDVDNAKALEWARKAVGQGNTKAKYSVGRLLLIGEAAADREEALSLLQQSIDAGIDEAGMFLAEAYATGRYGLAQDQSAAISILDKLSARGNTRAAEVIKRMQTNAP